MSCFSLSIAAVSVLLLLLLLAPPPPPPPPAACVLPVPDVLVVEPVLALLELVPLVLPEACDESLVAVVAVVAGVEDVACVVVALLLVERVFWICMVGVGSVA